MLHNEKLDNSSCDFERCGLCEKPNFGLGNPRKPFECIATLKSVLQSSGLYALLLLNLNTSQKVDCADT